MGIFSGGVLVTFFLIYIEYIVADQHCIGKTINQALQYERHLSQAFLTLEVIGLQQCSQKCLMRTKCQIISFDFHTFTCELGEDISYSVLSSRNTTGTISRSTLLQYEVSLLTSCAGHSCNVDNVCIELSSGQSTCVSTLVYTATTTTAMSTTTTTTLPTTTTTPPPPTSTTLPPTTSTTTLPTTTTQVAEVLCGNIPSVTNAVTPTSAERSVGTTLSYTCITGHILTGNPDITCQQNGQWSSLTLVCISCDTNVFTYNQDLNFCYKLELDIRYKNTEARSYCSGLGGRLAKVDTTQKLDLLVSYIPSNARAFVDGSDSAVENTWVYSDGTSVNMDLFPTGTPTIDTGLNCMIIQGSTGLMNEQDCLLNRFVICDKTLV
ncbi:uncharacterized protein LOC117333579 [Pecten maximus]|uniref:uncharacterized protein LOC117333579 n=1 Tax=Pecten maximus TaxID=6579 RepID=UPI001458EC1F|nr:uncharacterized protein LOC117333579 [Pecten maximus]